MPIALFVLRLLLATVFFVAAVGKFLDRPGSRKALVEFGVPGVLARPTAIVLPVAELAVAILLLPNATAWVGSLGALALLAVFIAGIAYSVARGRHPDCHCFGQIYSAPAGLSTLVRNGLLAAAAATVLVFGWNDPGPGLLDWATGMSAGELAALSIGSAGLAAITVLAWFVLQLGRSVGRLQLALDGLKESAANAPAPTMSRAALPAGLPIGRVAPAFELESISGERVSLDSLTGTRTLMLTFVDPDCAPCGELMPDLVRWQSREDLSVVAVSRGSVAANRKKVADHGLTNVLLQKDREVWKLYEVQGTPSALLVGRDGRIASTIAGGAEAIRALAARAPVIVERAAATSAARAGDNGHAPPKRLSVGDRVPAMSLSDLDDQVVDLGALRGNDTVLLFWRPSCGFCARMAPEVKDWAAHAANGGTRLVLVALDTPEANAAMDLGATIALDPEMKAFNAFGATGTPVAVKIDRRGRVASNLAIGTEHVRALAKASGLG